MSSQRWRSAALTPRVQAEWEGPESLREKDVDGETMSNPIGSFLARIYRSGPNGDDGTVVAAGFLIAPGLVCTCAHVVRDALMLGDMSVPPTADVSVDFPFLGEGKVAARVATWVPPRADDDGNDIAVLQLRADPPPGAQPAPLVVGGVLTDQSFYVFGFPEGYDNGVGTSGLVGQERPNSTVQMEVPRLTGYRVQGGFSGAPVWSSQATCVIGMVVQADLSEQVRVGFLIPTAMIARECPQLPRIEYDDWIAQEHPAQGSNRQSKLAAALQERGARHQPTHRPARRYRIDSDAILLDFDLEPQIAFFMTHIGQEGIYPFATGGSFEILKSYVIARMQRYMEKEMKRTVIPRQVTLTRDDVGAGTAIIDERIAKSYGASLAELLSQQSIDTLLMIWNQGIPRSVLKPLARSYVDQATRQLQPLVEDKSRVLVVLWINLGDEPLDGFPPIPPLQIPEKAVVSWFRQQLAVAHVDEADIQPCIAALKVQLEIYRGYPPGIYAAMKEIIDGLKQRRGRHAQDSLVTSFGKAAV